MKPQGLGERIDGLLRAFGAVRDPRLVVVDGLPEPMRSPGALLATVLGQDIKIGSLTRLMRELHLRLGDRLLAFPASEWAQLERACRFAWLAEWPHKESLAGWVLSVSDFLRSHGPVAGWKVEFGRPVELVDAMARELPWMGSRSPSKVKGWRLARWLVRDELSVLGWSPTDRQGLVLPVAAVQRPLQTLGWLPGGFPDWSVGRRQEWFDGRGESLDPAAAWVSLELVLARGHSGPACQERLKGCRACPVRADCPSPGRE